MKQLFLTLTFITTFTFAFASKNKEKKTENVQPFSTSHFNVKWGFPVENKYGAIGTIGNDSVGYKYLELGDGKIIVTPLGNKKSASKEFAYGQTPKEMPKVAFSLGFGTPAIPVGQKKGITTEGLVNVGGKNYWIFAEEDPKDDKRLTAFAQELDIITGSPVGNAKELVTIYHATSGVWDDQNFTIKTSRDGNRLLMWTDMKDKKDKSNFYTYHLATFDSELNPVWEKDIKLPYENMGTFVSFGVLSMGWTAQRDRIDIVDSYIDKRGAVYFILEILERDKKNKETGQQTRDYHTEVVRYSGKSDKPMVFSLVWEGKRATNAMLAETPKGGLVCAGYYLNDDVKGREAKFLEESNGMFMQKITPKGLKNYYNGFFEFKNDIIFQHKPEKERKKLLKKKQYPTIAHIKLRDLRFEDDSSMTIIGEQFWRTISTTYDKYGVPHTRTYVFNRDVYVSSFLKGNLQWSTKIPKSQTTVYPYAYYGDRLTMNFSTTDDAHRFIFVDHPKNFDLPEDKAPKAIAAASGKVDAVKVEINRATGKMNKTLLYNGKESKQYYELTEAEQIGKNSFLAKSWKNSMWGGFGGWNNVVFSVK